MDTDSGQHHRSSPARLRGAGYLDVAVVVGVLAIAAAVALPRHAQILRDVRREQADALRSSARSAARLAHEVWRVGGKPASVLVRSRLVHMDHGYPVSADLPLLLDDSETMSFHGDGGAWQHMDLPPDHPCGVSYAPPGNDIDPPAIVLHDSGC